MISCIRAFCVKGLRGVKVKYSDMSNSDRLKVIVRLFQVCTSSNHDDSHIALFWGVCSYVCMYVNHFIDYNEE